MTDDIASSDRRAYRLRASLILAYLVPGAILAAIAGFSLWYSLLYLSRGKQPGEVSIAVPIATCLFTSLMAAYCILNVMRTRLVISPEGIEYCTLFGNRRSSWRNVLRIGDIAHGRRRQYRAQALILGGYERPSGESIADIPTSSSFDWIPVSWFEGDWQHGEIGEQIRRYAPHLFEDNWPDE